MEFADNSDPVCPTYSVLFIDFGNREKVKATQVRPIDPALRAVPAQAHQASLAHIKVQSPDCGLSNFLPHGRPLDSCRFNLLVQQAFK